MTRLAIVILWACTGPSAPEPPVVEAQLAPGPVWESVLGILRVEVLDGPVLAVGLPNTTNASDDGWAYGEMTEAPVVYLLEDPFGGGSILDYSGIASEMVVQADHGSPLRAADWTGDGVLDLLVGHQLYAGSFDALVSQDQAVAVLEPSTRFSRTLGDIEPCDLDLDGILDLCTNHGIWLGPIEGALTDAELVATYDKPLIGETRPVAEGAWFEDLDGDGDLEWLVGARGELLLVEDPLAQAVWDLPAQADAVWTGVSGERGHVAVVDDVDGDGRRDILATDTFTSVIFTDPAGGSFPNGPVVFEGFGSQIVAGDFDGDGHTDAALANRDDEVALFLGPFQPGTYERGDAAAVWKGRVDRGDKFGRGLFAEDVDADGTDDLIVLAPSWYDAEHDRDVARMHLLWGGGL